MTGTPRRIQLRRTNGWRMPQNTVKVDRTTPWGNPFGVEYSKWEEEPGWFLHGHGQRLERVKTKADGLAKAVALHAAWLKETKRQTYRDQGRPDPVDIMKVLRGKNLACWCPLDQPCHADVLLELANAPLACEAV